MSGAIRGALLQNALHRSWNTPGRPQLHRQLLTHRTITTINVPPPRLRPSTSFSTASSPLRRVRLPRRSARSRKYSSKPDPLEPPNAEPTPNPTAHLGSPSPPLSVTQRFRKLSREYGWSALGVYLLLSALDFPFCFLAVRMLGTERIGHWEHVIVSGVKEMVLYPIYGWPEGEKERKEAREAKVAVPAEGGEGVAQTGAWSWGVEEAQEANKSNATIWTQLALAYAVHKSFIFLRVPLTAAVTPRVVRTLRGWGWDIGKRRTKTKVASVTKE